MILYPGAFNMTTGPAHWETLLRCRAIDNQVFVGGIAPATDECANYVSYGHTMLFSPWGKVLARAEYSEAILYAPIDVDEVQTVRCQIPTQTQRRHDLYETISKMCVPCHPAPCKPQQK